MRKRPYTRYIFIVTEWKLAICELCHTGKLGRENTASAAGVETKSGDIPIFV